jgi:hypothetical protein
MPSSLPSPFSTNSAQRRKGAKSAKKTLCILALLGALGSLAILARGMATKRRKNAQRFAFFLGDFSCLFVAIVLALDVDGA